jgi:hypothetical protein
MLRRILALRASPSSLEPMSRPRVLFDGLWQCLCPSLDSIAFARAIESSSLTSSSRRSYRLYSRAGPRIRFNEKRQYTTAHGNDRHRPENSGRYGRDRPINEDKTSIQKLVDCRRPYRELDDASIPLIYDALRQLRNRPNALEKVAEFVTYLLVNRGQPPSPFLYETLVQASVDTQASAGSLNKLLREMEKLEIHRSSALYHGALAALAVHPNYRLRNGILKAMERSWVAVSREGEQHVLLGLLRDGQYEIAFEKLEDMVERKVKIDGWVYDIFIFAFAREDFLDDAIKIMHHSLEDPRRDLHLNLWYYLLDTCSRAFHHEGTLYLWRRLVHTKIIDPSDGIILNVLNTAARHRDTILSSEAIERLTDRGTKLQRHHYEAMVECYAAKMDIRNALQILCIMAKAGISPTLASTRPVYLCLTVHHHLLETAVEALHGIRKEYDVPIAILDGIIDAAVETGRHMEAMDIYRHIRHLCSEGPGLKTVQLLLKSCHDLDMLIFLAAEQPILAMQANPATYERVIHDCAISGRLDMAFRLLKEIPARESEDDEADESWWVSRKTVLAIVKACLEAKDDRFNDLMETAKSRNMSLDAAVEELKESLRTKETSTPGSRVIQAVSDELQRDSISS